MKSLSLLVILAASAMLVAIPSTVRQRTAERPPTYFTDSGGSPRNLQQWEPMTLSIEQPHDQKVFVICWFGQSKVRSWWIQEGQTEAMGARMKGESAVCKYYRGVTVVKQEVH